MKVKKVWARLETWSICVGGLTVPPEVLCFFLNTFRIWRQCSDNKEVLQGKWEPWRWVQWPAIESWQWPNESIVKADPLTIIRKVAGELNTHQSMVVQHLKHIGMVGASWADCKLKKSSSLILCNNNALILYRIVMCNEKWILYDDQWQPAQWLVGEEAPKYFLKLNLCQKRSWSLFGGLLPVLSTTVSWILMTWLHLRSMLSKSVRCAENLNIYSWHWSTEISQCPITHHTTKPSKVEWTGLQVLLLSLCSADLSQTDYHFFKHLSFLKWKCFYNQQEAENAF